MTEPGGKGIVEILQSFIDSRLFDVHTTIPGKFLSYNADTGLAEVQPLVNLKRNIEGNDFTVKIPPIANVPVINLSTSSFILKFPIKKGDGCAIFFSEVSLGNYLSGGGSPVDPEDYAQFSLTDAFCIPGLFNKGNRPSGTPTIELTDAGVLKLLKGTSSFTKGEALETLLNNFFNTIAAAPPGGTTVQNAALLTVIQTACTTALTQTAGIKSAKIKGE